MEEVMLKVAAFVAIIVAGHLAGRSRTLGPRPEQCVSKIVFTFTLPCAIVHAFGAAEFTHDLLILVPLGLACALIPYLAVLGLTRRSERRDRVFYLLNCCGFNIGCFCLPFVQTLFPAQLAVTTCLFDAGNAIMMTGGSYALTGLVAGKGPVEHPVRFVAKRLAKSIAFDAYIILIVLAVAGIHIPDAVVQFTAPIANANSFLAMFMLGLMIRFEVSREKLAKVARLIGLRVIVSIVASALAFTLLPFDATTRIVIVMLLWAPASAMGPTFTLWSDGDFGLAGLANAITIILGIVATTTIVLASGVMGIKKAPRQQRNQQGARERNTRATPRQHPAKRSALELHDAERLGKRGHEDDHHEHRCHVLHHDRPGFRHLEGRGDAHLVDDRLRLDDPANEDAGQKRNDRHDNRVGDEVGEVEQRGAFA